MSNNLAAYRRICEFFGTTNQSTLAAKLKCSQSRLSQISTRGSAISPSILLVLVTDYMVNPNWVRYGDPHPQKLKFDV